MGAARLGVRLAAAALLLLALLAAGASASARAAGPSHAFLYSITGTGPLPPPPAPPVDYSPDRYFEDACGAAVDSQGNVYVADYFHHAVDVYNQERIFITRIGNLDPADGPCGLAVDSAGRLYVNSWRGGVTKLTPSEFPYPYCEPAQKFPAGSLCPPPGERPGPAPTYTATAFLGARSTGVAVDPATGRVYVDERSSVGVFEASGSPVEVGGKPLRVGLGNLTDAYGVAVSDFPGRNGYVYVPDAATGSVKVFNPAGDPSKPVETIDGAGTPQAGFTSLVDASVAVDENDGHVFVVDNLGSPFERAAAVVDEFSPAGSYRGQLPRALLAAEPSGLVVDQAGRVYVTSGNTEGSVLYAFGPTVAAAQLTATKTGAGKGSITSVPAGIACGTACSAEFNVGEAVTLQAAADAHSTFTGWTVTGSPGACPGTGPCQVTLNANTQVSANFDAIPQRTLTVAKTGAGKGTLASTPAGIQCEAACLGQAAEFNVGEAVTLQAAADGHSTFTGWTVTGSPGACPGTGPCQVTLNANTQVSANFDAIPQRTLTVTLQGRGSGTVSSSPAGIECGPVCAHAYPQGTALTLLARAAPGSKFAGWSGSGCAGTAACHIDLGADSGLSARFEVVQHIISVGLAGPGSGTVSSSPGGIDCGASCARAFDQGSLVTLTAHPARGSALSGWSGCDSQVGNSCRVAVNTYRPVIAAFGPNPPSSLQLTKLTAVGDTVTLHLLVPRSGTLSASGQGLRPVAGRPVDAGAATLRLRLSRAGMRALQAAKHRKLGVQITVSFKSRGRRKPEVVKGDVTFRATGKGPAKGKGEAALVQKGDLFGAFQGGIEPAALPRHTPAPISVVISGTVKTLSGERPPALRKIAIAVNRNGHLDTRGLPTCRLDEIDQASTAGALEACEPALVGRGSYRAATAFPEQEPFPAHGRILAFNGRVDGHQVILAHVYGTNLAPITRILVFHISHTSGTFGTVLTAALPPSLNHYGYLEHIQLELHREFTYRGRPHSYLSGACAAPPGFPGATFPFAHVTMTFEDGRSLASTLNRHCRVRE